MSKSIKHIIALLGLVVLKACNSTSAVAELVYGGLVKLATSKQMEE